MLRLPASFEIIRMGSRRVVVAAGKGAFLFTIVESSIRIVDRAGAVRIDDLAGMLRNRCTVADLEEILPLHPRFEWLDHTRTWFWFRPTFSPRPGRVRNRLVNKIAKVISVAGPLRWGELQTLLERRRPIGVLPPSEVLLEVYRRIPWLILRDDTITRMELCDNHLPPP
jgi:hypothetical protein